MRLIDADALYEELRYMPYDNILEGTIGHERPLRAIMNAPTVEMPGWISVDERLPDRPGEYLTYHPKCGVQVVKFATNLLAIDEYDLAGKARPGWYDFDNEYGYYEWTDVTHWMPLPKPPEEVSEHE